MAGLLDGMNLSNDLFDFKRNTNQQVGKVKGDVLNPIDVTTQRLNEGVALTNKSDTTLKGRITAYRSTVVDQLDGIIGALSGGLLNTKDITKAVKVGNDGVEFDTDDLYEAAGAAMGVPVYGGETGAKRVLAGMVNDEFKRLTGLNLGSLIQVGGGGDFKVSSSWRTKLGKQVLDTVKDYAGIDEFVDISVTTAAYNTILYQSGIFGMKDAYGKLWDNYPYAAFRQDAFIEAMNHMITNGDIESIDVVMQKLDDEGKNSLLNKYPDFIEKLFSKFSFDRDMYPEDYPALREKLLAIVVRVAGPNWMYRETQFGTALNLGISSAISKDMVTLLTPVEELMPLLASSGKFRIRSAFDVLNEQMQGPLNYL